MSKRKLLDLANKLANADFELNGSFPNAPYTIIHNDRTYHAVLRFVNGEGIMISIERPAVSLASALLR